MHLAAPMIYWRRKLKTKRKKKQPNFNFLLGFVFCAKEMMQLMLI